VGCREGEGAGEAEVDKSVKDRPGDTKQHVGGTAPCTRDVVTRRYGNTRISTTRVQADQAYQVRGLAAISSPRPGWNSCSQCSQWRSGRWRNDRRSRGRANKDDSGDQQQR